MRHQFFQSAKWMCHHAKSRPSGNSRSATGLSTLVPYWLAYQEFYNVNLSSAVTQTTWQRFFDEAEPIYCAVAKQGEKVLGFVHYVIHRSTWAT